MDCDHDWVDDNYQGYSCSKCGAFLPYGLEPWMPPDDEPEMCCEHCGKLLEDFSDLGCEYCDVRY
jgi:hypothetical protein